MKLRTSKILLTYMAASLAILISGNDVLAQATETDQAEESKTDWSDLNGTWKPSTGAFAGQALPAEQLKDMTLTMKDGTFEVKVQGTIETGKLELGEVEDGKPKKIDINSESGPNAGKTLPAIYRIKDGDLTICYGIMGTRPTDFVSDQDNPNLLMEYKKQEAEADK